MLNCQLHTCELKIPPPLLFIATAALMWLVSYLVPQCTLELPLGLRVSAALILFVFSAIVGLGATYQFIYHRTTLLPFAPEKSRLIVATGVYGLSRNPMYLSLAGTLFALGLYLANPLALIVPFLFIAAITHVQIKPEERILLQRFGEEYRRYSEHVRRWL